jgi:hypothetical protein
MSALISEAVRATVIAPTRLLCWLVLFFDICFFIFLQFQSVGNLTLAIAGPVLRPLLAWADRTRRSATAAAGQLSDSIAWLAQKMIWIFASAFSCHLLLGFVLSAPLVMNTFE